MVGYSHNSGIGHMVMVAIMLQVVANALSIWNCDVLVHDGVPNLAATPDGAVIQNYRILDNGSTFDMSISAKHRAADCAA